jgi:hypothetical protein
MVTWSQKPVCGARKDPAYLVCWSRGCGLARGPDRAAKAAPSDALAQALWHKPHTKRSCNALETSPVFRQACLSSSSHTSLLPPAQGQLQSELCMSPGRAASCSHTSLLPPTESPQWASCKANMSPGLSFFLLSHFPASSHNRTETQGSELDISPGLACFLLSQIPSSSPTGRGSSGRAAKGSEL